MDTSHKVSTQPSRLDSQTVTFRDGPIEWYTSMEESMDPLRVATVHGDVNLQDFFARPIQIYKYVWTPGVVQALVPYFDPYTLFLSNPRVSNRMANYKNFFGKLHLKFMVNGNSFYFGRMMPFFVPLPADDSAFVPQDIRIKTLASQRLKMFIDPSESTGGEMELPFVWYKDMLDITVAGNIAAMGTMGMVELNPLLHANGATTPIDITVFAWMTDVKFSGPTMSEITTLTPQAGGKMAVKDEYGKGPLSTVASALAAGAGKLSSVPYIGKYMRATQMIGSSLSGVAELFGFSRPTIIADSVQMRISPISTLAVTNGGDPSAKLTVDCKQELSIDPAIVGLGSLDELSLNSIACRETFMYTFPWTVAKTAGDILSSNLVTPIWSHTDSVSSFSRLTLPACAYTAYPFEYWRGTMRYRFQIVASAYHKGRIKFVWDPTGTNATPESNVSYTKIVDLTDERDFVIDISWANDSTWLYTTAPGIYWSTSSALNGTLSPGFHNGTLNVYVLNSLTTPNSTVNNDIAINVYVSMCGDAEFAVPNDAIAEIVNQVAAPSALVVQAGDVETMEVAEDSPTAPAATEECVPCTVVSTDVGSVYFGEKVSSFRQLIKRYALLTSMAKISTTGDYVRWTMPNFPMTRGYTNNGMYGTGVTAYNLTNTTMPNYMSLAFLLYRGGFRYKYVQGAISTGLASNMAVERLDSRNSTTTGPVVFTVTDVTTDVTAVNQALVNKPNGLRGAHYTASKIQPSLEVELPFYSSNRFHAARTDATATRYNAERTALAHRFTMEAVSTHVIDTFVAGAEDLTFHYFQGCRPFFVKGVAP